jgi:hypothetical protein
VLERGLALQKRGKMSKTPSSKYIGVYLEQVKGLINKKWVVRIAYKGLKSSVGRFDTEKEAAEFYNKKAIELWGEGARLNIITDE